MFYISLPCSEINKDIFAVPYKLLWLLVGDGAQLAALVCP